VASGVFCDDQLSCTDDLCLEDGSCEAQIVLGACLIESTCYPVGVSPVEDPCAVCDPSEPTTWSPAGADGLVVPCETGDPCDLEGVCATDAVQCVGQPLVCDDEDPCTTDVCEQGVCVFDPVVCDDGDLCTADLCDEGVCVFVPQPCDDTDPCTTDACEQGECVFTPIADCGSDGDASDGSDASEDAGAQDVGPDPEDP